MTLKKLVCDVLNLNKFDEKIMDEKIERIYIANNKVRFHFKDGNDEIREYEEKKRGTLWTEERRQKQMPKIKEYWKDENHRKQASERMKKRRSEKKWQSKR